MTMDILALVLAGFLLTGYVVLEGFDLGVGILRLFIQDEKERLLMLKAIEPTWDAAEVWLVAAALVFIFAFPQISAPALTGFYFSLKLWLIAIVVRAFATELRNRCSVRWHHFCDLLLGLASAFSAFFIGLIVGDLVVGLPLDEEHEFAVSTASVLNPYSLLLGATSLALFLLHGGLFLILKTEGELQKKVRHWITPAILVFTVLYLVVTVVTPFLAYQMVSPFVRWPILFLLPFLTLIAVAALHNQVRRALFSRAFLTSCAIAVGFSGLFWLGIFPNLVISNSAPENNLTIFNSVASEKVTSASVILAALGLPVVFIYTFCAFWIFRGKVKGDETRRLQVPESDTEYWSVGSGQHAVSKRSMSA